MTAKTIETMKDLKLSLCPFCGGRAELDTHRGYRAMNGRLGNAVAMYCTKCNADMMLCYEDFPQYNVEELTQMLANNWNKRNAETNTPEGTHHILDALWPLLFINPT
jgi:hypothetical protein